MITGYGKTLKAVIEEARSLGVRAVIDKPFKINQITEAIREIIPPRTDGATPVAITLVNIGFGNVVVASRIVAVVHPGSSPARRLKDDAREGGRLVDATQGRRTRSIIVTDSNHVILSAVQGETISQRLAAPPTRTSRRR